MASLRVHAGDEHTLRLLRDQGLPMPLSGFVGRVQEKSDVIRSVRASALVTLTGAGGIGKSRLALEVAAVQSRRGHRVAFVDVAAVSEPGSVLPAVATALEVSGDPRRPQFDAVVDNLAVTPLLLVLDGCEHLRDSCADLAARLLDACDGLRILATSRERLGAAGEAVSPVPPLSLRTAGRPVRPGAAEASEAVQLFCDRAMGLHSGFLPTPANVRAIVEICRRVDGNPLAIELAAGRVAVLPPTEIAARLDDPMALLGGGPSAAPHRQRSLRATMDWSYDLLSPPERTLFRRLSVLRGTFAVGAAEDACRRGDVEASQILPLLQRLVDTSLLVSESTASGPLFRLSETVRAYAAERLREDGQAAPPEARRRAGGLALIEGGGGRESSG